VEDETMKKIRSEFKRIFGDASLEDKTDSNKTDKAEND